jgi:hypothetical protein
LKLEIKSPLQIGWQKNTLPIILLFLTLRGALLDFFNQLQQMEIMADILRAIEDGDYVVLHK